MKIVIDTNILIAALIKDSTSRDLLLHSSSLEFYAPRFSLEEVKKHQSFLIKKAKVNEQEFEVLLLLFIKKIVFLEDELIRTKLQDAIEIIGKIDEKDSPFIAAALITKAVIWSNDAHFKKQNKVKTYTTKELLELLK